LFSMLKDGELDPDEIDTLRAEAKRLHLTAAEVNALIEQVIKEHSSLDSDLPLHKIAEKPELAVEHYKSLLGQIRQLGLLTDASRFEHAAQDQQRLSASDMALWQKIQGKA
jgi:voltage-gated potassium channel